MQSNELIHTNMDEIFDGYNWFLSQFGGPGIYNHCATYAQILGGNGQSSSVMGKYVVS